MPHRLGFDGGGIVDNFYCAIPPVSVFGIVKAIPVRLANAQRIRINQSHRHPPSAESPAF
jgi:hypothetical protein